MPAQTEDSGSTSDHGLGLYSRQMGGSIPLLKPSEELELTQRLDLLRRRYRHAVLWNWSVLERVVETFDAFGAPSTPLERSVDVFPGAGLTIVRIQKRLPRHLGKLRQLVNESRKGPRGRRQSAALARRKLAKPFVWRRSYRRAPSCSTPGRPGWKSNPYPGSWPVCWP